jgi:aspartyl-tRNA(Asn)/glutamyl-tRNA(Gln) amidotransferase subunit C
MITKEQILKIARLSSLEINDEKAVSMASDLESIFEWINQLNQVQTDSVIPYTDWISMSTLERDDVITEPDRHSEILSNAPDQAFGMFAVPKVVE